MAGPPRTAPYRVAGDLRQSCGMVRVTRTSGSARGLNVLAQIGKTAAHPSNAFPEESFSVVTSGLRDEHEIQPLDSAVATLGHLDNPAGIRLIIRYQSHPRSAIRFNLGGRAGVIPERLPKCRMPPSAHGDANEEVRDWATFGLGVLGDLDSADIRDALLQRLSDSNEDLRNEAMATLGKRRDRRSPAFLACRVGGHLSRFR